MKTSCKEFMNRSELLRKSFVIGSGGGVLQISSDRDDRMGEKSKPKKIPGPKFNSKKIPC